jgi:hypothetical protein
MASHRSTMLRNTEAMTTHAFNRVAPAVSSVDAPDAMEAHFVVVVVPPSRLPLSNPAWHRCTSVSCSGRYTCYFVLLGTSRASRMVAHG